MSHTVSSIVDGLLPETLVFFRPFFAVFFVGKRRLVCAPPLSLAVSGSMCVAESVSLAAE